MPKRTVSTTKLLQLLKELEFEHVIISNVPNFLINAKYKLNSFMWLFYVLIDH